MELAIKILKKEIYLREHDTKYSHLHTDETDQELKSLYKVLQELESLYKSIEILDDTSTNEHASITQSYDYNCQNMFSEQFFKTYFEMQDIFIKNIHAINTTNDNYQNNMSKRFYAACAAMQGILAAHDSYTIEDDISNIIYESYKCADELLKQENNEYNKN